MGSLPAATSPQLLAAEAPRNAAERLARGPAVGTVAWETRGRSPHRSASGSSSDAFQFGESADYVGWTPRSAMQPRPAENAARPGDAACRTAGRAWDQEAGLGVQQGSREGLRGHVHTAAKPASVTSGGEPSRSLCPALGSDQGHEPALPPGSCLRGGGREAINEY